MESMVKIEHELLESNREEREKIGMHYECKEQVKGGGNCGIENEIKCKHTYLEHEPYTHFIQCTYNLKSKQKMKRKIEAKREVQVQMKEKNISQQCVRSDVKHNKRERYKG